jgi:hypothetical protein
MDLKSEILQRIETLSSEQQSQLLAYCNTFEHTRPAENTARFCFLFRVFWTIPQQRR